MGDATAAKREFSHACRVTDRPAEFTWIALNTSSSNSDTMYTVIAFMPMMTSGLVNRL